MPAYVCASRCFTMLKGHRCRHAYRRWACWDSFALARLFVLHFASDSACASAAVYVACIFFAAVLAATECDLQLPTETFFASPTTASKASCFRRSSTGDGTGGIKREPSDDGRADNEAPNKRPRNSGGGRAVDVRFLLQSRNAGAIIGKGGANINSLRKEFKASISVPDCPGPERILSIVADLDTLGDILLNIIPKLDDFAQHTGQNGGSESEMRLLMHQSHAGCIIGRAGCRIKELRESTGANIKVHGSCCPGSTERIVKVTGSPAVVVDCIKQICDIIGVAPIKGLNKPYDPHNFDPEFAQEYGGFAEGATGGASGSSGSLAGMTMGQIRGRSGGSNVAFWRDEPLDAFTRGRAPKRGPWGEPHVPPHPFADEPAPRPWHSPPPLSAGGMHRDLPRPYRGGGMARGSYGRGSYNGKLQNTLVFTTRVERAFVISPDTIAPCEVKNYS
ncbi:hypothetical protein V5799_032460 [Amblyomma americanum]|uniref:K Homology domain-containing protein n=1 Tax=Amblyomma americanum TaxID=6943 RepID=A0AAQ4DR42_AMBAM